ncbi:hypothetical protein A2U01_0103215, partial [Trifolium medium]|nr:hypothetical protein [Trifolium medium]
MNQIHRPVLPVNYAANIQ